MAIKSGKRGGRFALLSGLTGCLLPALVFASPSDFADTALRLCKAGKLKDSLPYYARAIAQSPGQSDLYYNRALVYQQLSMFDAALSDWGTAIALKPRSSTSYYNRGLLFGQMKRHRQAIADYDRALKLDNQYVDAYLNRGNAHFELKEYDLAIADFSNAIEIEPHDAQAFYNRAAAYALIGHMAEAVSDYQEAISINPQFARAYFNRSLIYLSLHQGGEAASDGSKFISLKGWHDRDSAYAALIAYLGLRQIHEQTSANQWLKEARNNLNRQTWPSPIVTYFAGQLPLDGLLKAARDNDMMTEARTYVGIDFLISNRSKDAVEHLTWVSTHGNKTFPEYKLARSWLKGAVAD